MGALLKAVRNELRTALNADHRKISVRPEGRPPPWFSDWFIGVDEASVASTERQSLREVFSVSVVLTKTVGKYPADRADEIYLENIIGLDALERQVIVAIHGNQTIRSAANDIIGAPTDRYGDAIQKPLYYIGRGQSAPRGAEWNGSEEQAVAFMTRTLNFSDAVRIQALSSMK
jgi:hypothetical protein